MKNQKIEIYTFASKIGNISIIYKENRIYQIDLNSKNKIIEKGSHQIKEVGSQILQFLSGFRQTFNIPFTVTGTTFQQDVLRYICTIPYGKTVSYKEVANHIGHPRAYRAVGSALRNNKLPLIIPCHRVINSNGSYGNYNGGKDMKKLLIDLEKKCM